MKPAPMRWGLMIGNSDSMVLRRNHIHHTGLDTSSSRLQAKACIWDATIILSRITNSLIEGNYIHHLRTQAGRQQSTSKEKVKLYGNIIHNNVIHNTTIGTRYPMHFRLRRCEPSLDIEGNAVWSCGEGIYCMAEKCDCTKTI